MVTTQKNTIAEAIKASQRVTCAEIVVVIAPTSDTYQSFITLYGLFLGSLVSLYAWHTRIVPDFPILLAIQVASITLLTCTPWLRRLCMALIPTHIKYHRAGRRAYEEYLMVTHHVSSATPVVLLYISQSERYTHILHSRLVREKIPNEVWRTVVADLTSQVKAHGLTYACDKTVNRMSELLAPHFPAKSQSQIFQKL